MLNVSRLKGILSTKLGEKGAPCTIVMPVAGTYDPDEMGQTTPPGRTEYASFVLAKPGGYVRTLDGSSVYRAGQSVVFSAENVPDGVRLRDGCFLVLDGVTWKMKDVTPIAPTLGTVLAYKAELTA